MAEREQVRPLSGVYFILSTPFLPDFSIDFESVARLVNEVIGAGVDGITVLGVAGEAQKLSGREREDLVKFVADTVAQRCPVVVGASHDGTEQVIHAAQFAEHVGSAGLLVAPPTFLNPGAQLTQHLRRLSEATKLAIVLQDYPAVNGVTMTPVQMADLVAQIERIASIKLEGAPTPWRTSETLRRLSRKATVLGGLGATYLLDELRHGAMGTMTGFAYPEILVAILSHWSHGRAAEATELYYRFLPLLLLEGQPNIGLAIRKEILRRRGWINYSVVREPGPRIDESLQADIAFTLENTRPGRLLAIS